MLNPTNTQKQLTRTEQAAAELIAASPRALAEQLAAQFMQEFTLDNDEEHMRALLAAHLNDEGAVARVMVRCMDAHTPERLPF